MATVNYTTQYVVTTSAGEDKIYSPDEFIKVANETAKDNGFIMAEDMQHIWQAEDFMVSFCYNANFKLNKFTTIVHCENMLA